MSTIAQPATALTPSLAAAGALDSLSPALRSRLLGRGTGDQHGIEEEVRAVIERVRTGGDAALKALAARYDRVDLESLEVPRPVWLRALDALPAPLRSAMELAVEHLTTFHRAQLPPPLDVEVAPGVRLRRLAQPLGRIGVYAPGGRAVYPSSVLMGVVPARVAGVAEILVCSPPSAGGIPSAVVLAASALVGADRVFALGGAGAIAALAHGTASVPRVDRIIGPGNAWVTEAKRQISGHIGVDCPAGPSEVLILADRSADPALVAAELLAQAEHDPAAAAVLVTTERTHLDSVANALAEMLVSQPRAPIVRAALAANGALLYAESVADALRFANEYAPEHLVLFVREPKRTLAAVRNAGTVFVGTASSVVFGDYLTGANHVLPTAGMSRSFSGLGTLDFLRWVTVQEVDADAAARLSEPTAVLAMAEGLPGHAQAARRRAVPPTHTEVTAASAVRPASLYVAFGDPFPVAAAGPSTIAAQPAGTARPRTREAYRDIRTYDPGRESCDVDLSDNTNLFGVCPAVRRALASLPDDAVTRYPPVYASRLKDAAGRLFGVTPECVTTGCGSDDLIDSALRAFCEPGDVLECPQPTFGVVPMFARMNGVVPESVPLLPGFQLDIERHLRSRARTLYLCTPNNPTGTTFNRPDVIRLIENFDGVILLDEAYADFASANFLSDVLRSRNTIILRTLSKAGGLAGLRVGLALGPPPLIAELEKSRGPYKVSQAAELAAVTVLERGRDWMRETVMQVRANRAQLTRRLNEIGQRVLPSEANFVLLPLPGGAAAPAVAKQLRALGVGVRPFPALPQLGDCIRVTIGPWPMMQRFLTAYATVLQGLASRGDASC